jgi:hypothetical protein
VDQFAELRFPLVVTPASMIGDNQPPPIKINQSSLIYSFWDEAILIWDVADATWQRFFSPKRQLLTIAIPPNTYKQFVYTEVVPANSLQGAKGVHCVLIPTNPITDSQEHAWRRDWVINSLLTYSPSNAVSGYSVAINFPDYEVGTFDLAVQFF